jgi:hypothetical protein
MTEYEILNTTINGKKIVDMGTMEFMQWLSKKLNNLANPSSDIVALNTLIKFPPMGGKYPDVEKVKIIQKLLMNNITI